MGIVSETGYEIQLALQDGVPKLLQDDIDLYRIRYKYQCIKSPTYCARIKV
jgi:hypothetical protein